MALVGLLASPCWPQPWLLLAPAGPSPGYCWPLLATAGYCWLLLATAGYCWLLLATTGYCWLLLATAGYCWPQPWPCNCPQWLQCRIEVLAEMILGYPPSPTLHQAEPYLYPQPRSPTPIHNRYGHYAYCPGRMRMAMLTMS